MSQLTVEHPHAVATTSRRQVPGGIAFILGGLLVLAAAVFPDAGFVAGVGAVALGYAALGAGFLLIHRSAGSLIWGKLALIIAGVALLLMSASLVLLLADVPAPVFEIISVSALVLTMAIIVAAVAVARAGEATGILRWILFVPAVWAIVATLATFGVFGDATSWTDIGLGIVFAITGVAYVVGRR